MKQHEQDDKDRAAYRRIFGSVNTYSQFDDTELRTIRDIVLNQLYSTPVEQLAYHRKQLEDLETA